MNRIPILLVAFVALVAGLAPAARDAADRTERVRFDHRRHARHLPACTFCHRAADPSALPEGAVRDDFARPVEAMCFCHPLPEGSLAPATNFPRAPEAPAPEPATPEPVTTEPTTAEPESSGPPAVPHPLEGREDCMMCHAAGGMMPVPADHSGRTNDTCTMCHTAPAPGAKAATPGGAAKQSAVPHSIDGSSNCLMCHEPGSDLEPAPADHAGRTNDTCTMCHTAPAPQGGSDAGTAATDAGTATAPSGPPAVPHPLEGRDNCMSCHAADGGMIPVPADHAGRTNDTCTMCHTAPAGGGASPDAGTTAAPSGPPRVPHITDGLPGCSSCHKAQGMRPIPADHSGRTDDTCGMCHPATEPMQAASSTSGPDPAVCALCHGVGADGRVALPTLPEPTSHVLAFRHPDHEAKAGAPCDACHTLAQADSGLPPAMPVCMSCHASAKQENCSKCHLHDARGRLETDLPDGRQLVPSAWWGAIGHVEGWEAEHGGAAGTNETLCRSCHEQSFCEACHLGEGSERRFHGAGWISMHGPSSRSADLDCTVCHDEQETCLSCHRRAGVALSSPDSAVPAGAGSYHPADWTYGPSGHPREARRNLGSCVACHSQGDCFACHQGVSPHGDSWVGGRCSAIEDTSPQLCLECHTSVPQCD
jgi:hypothetical protein